MMDVIEDIGVSDAEWREGVGATETASSHLP
ncbi:hypothetical protein LCGC14_1688090 [marine sediment metagenome]|uniref:Uncharacterized protein n=1 Tax=marine sediment metagenome TaxID=412755 RepID=A0A0F9HLQ8_9ZZZZ